MDKHIPLHPTRKKKYEHFLNLLTNYTNKNTKFKHLNDLEKRALNLEIGIFNYALKNYKNYSNKVLEYWNSDFAIYYSHRFVTIYSNLNPDSPLKNVTLIDRYLNNEFTEAELTHFTARELFTEKFDYLTKTKYKKDMTIEPLNIVVEDGPLQCRKCYSHKVTYYQLQTASGDESFTTYANCHNCGNKFKFR
jgi:DNA-directed RNA polymerase subunit M/transcription elongation factor TFIIS